MFTGTALSVRLLVYAGLSLFIINGPYLYMVVCVSYTYNLAWGGPEKWQKWGRAKWVLFHFCHHIKRSWSFLESSTFKSELFWEIFCVNSALFIHSPCQTGSQPMTGRYYMLHFHMFFKYVYNR